MGQTGDSDTAERKSQTAVWQTWGSYPNCSAIRQNWKLWKPLKDMEDSERISQNKSSGRKQQREWARSNLWEILAKNFLELLKDTKCKVKKAQQIPDGINIKKLSHTYETADYQNEKKNVKASFRAKTDFYKNYAIQQQKWKAGHSRIIFSIDSQKISAIQEFSLPQNDFFKYKGKKRAFSDKGGMRGLFTNRPLLKDLVIDAPQVAGLHCRKTRSTKIPGNV